MSDVQPPSESAAADSAHGTQGVARQSPQPARSGISNRQGTVIIVLLCLVTVVAAVLAYVAVTNQFSSPKYEQKSTALLSQLTSPKYEFKTVEFFGSSPSRQGGGAFKYSSIDADEAQLNALGAKGWEVVSSYLEMETAWPNFGSSKYVTGLQPNVRPQRLVIVLQRRLPSGG